MLRIANPPFVGSIPASASHKTANVYKMSILRKVFVIIFLVVSSSAFAADFEYNYGNPLIDAADAGNEYLVLSYITKGISVNSKGNFGTTALMRASIRGHETVVRRLLEAGADVNAKDVGGATALHLAARTGNVQIAEMLLKRSADPDAQDNDGYTPLQRATQTQYVAVISEMLKSGNANIDQKNKEGLSAMDIAHKTKNQKVIDVMGQNKAAQTQSQLLTLPDNKKVEPIVSAPVEDVKVEEMKPIVEEPKVEEKKLETIQQPVEPVAAPIPAPIKEKKNKDLVKDLRDVIGDKKSQAVVPHHPDQAIVKEVEPVEQEAPAKEENVKVSVAEAIKVPDEVDLRDSTNQLRIKIENQPDPIKHVTQPQTMAQASPYIRKVTMEISSFESEEDGVNFWDKLMKMDQFKNRNAELVEDKTDVLPKYVLRLSDFSKSAEVFEGCKAVRKSNGNVLCYVVHDVY